MKPPAHSITATPILVLANDDAWDTERINDELSRLEDDDALNSHPWAVYVSGASRYDLHARHKWSGGEASPADYLDGSELRITLKRHDPIRMAEVQDEVEREIRRCKGKDADDMALHAVWMKSAKFGIAEISGDEAIEGEYTKRSGVPDWVLRHLIDYHGGLAAMSKIGAAAWHVSKPLSESEKKPSAS